MFSDVSLILMAAIVRARNELVRVAVKLDPPRTIGRLRRMSKVDTIQLILWMCRAGCPWSMLPCPHNVSYRRLGEKTGKSCSVFVSCVACEAVRESSPTPSPCAGPVSSAPPPPPRLGPGGVSWCLVVSPPPPTSLSPKGWSYRYENEAHGNLFSSDDNRQPSAPTILLL